jgi:DNA-binding CsgD family transcriptional regulator
MSAPLALGELAALERTLHTLLAPRDHADPVSWSAAVCDAARRLVGESLHASVYLAGTDRPVMMHTTLDPAVPGAYFAHHWRSDTPMLELVRRRLPVAHSLMICPEHEYYASALYHDYIRPNRIDLSVGIGAYDACGVGPRLMLTYERRPTRPALDRATALLGAIVPAFAVGAEAWRPALAVGGDGVPGGASLPGATLVCDLAGRVLHETPGLAAALRGAPHAALVRDAARALAAAASLLLRRSTTPGAALTALDAARRTVPTVAGPYTLRCTLAADALASGQPALLVDVEPPAGRHARADTRAAAPLPDVVPATGAAHARADDAALRARFGLTAQELHVARLMAGRRTDAEIGTALGISPHTARTHAERVRRKLGVSRRAEVAGALAGCGTGAGAH